MIKINDLNKVYNKNKANQINVINKTSLELPNKGLVAFLGPSGSGKTTLLNVIGGLDSAKGKITYDDIEFENYQMNKIDKYRKENIGYVFQNYNLLPNETVYDNLAISLNLIGITDQNEIDKRVEYCLTAVGMFKYKKRLALALSGGQQQRVSIARALVKNSNIIIADEPTGNLDSANTIEVMNILKKISETKLVLLVTHNRDLAYFYCDRIIEIKDGSIISQNENSSLYQKLETRNNNIIYLQDMQKQEGSYDHVNLTIYTEEGEKPENLNLVVVYKNGNIYIESKENNLKIINNNSGVKLLDQKYKQLEESEIKNYKFDLSNFEKPENKGITFKSILKKVYNSIYSFLHARKRTKLLYFGFLISGIMVGLLLSVYNVYKHVDESMLTYEKDILLVEKDLNNPQNVFLTNIASKFANFSDEELNCFDIINIMNLRTSAQAIYSFNGSFIGFYPYVYSLYMPNTNLKESDLYQSLGKINIDDTEVVIDKVIADDLLFQFKKYGDFSYSDLLNQKLGAYTIVGITNRNSKSMYITNSQINLINNNNKSRWYPTNDGYSKYGCELADNNISYKVVNGTDFTNSQNEVMINIKQINQSNMLDLNYYSIGSRIRRGDQDCTIIGYFESDDTNAVYLTDETKFRYLIYSNGNTRDITKVDSFNIISGGMPKAGETLVSCYSKHKIGDTVHNINGKAFVVSGIYFEQGSKDDLLVNHVDYLKEALVYDFNYIDSNLIGITTSDVKKTKEIFEKHGFIINDSYTVTINNERKDNNEKLMYFQIATFAILAIIIIFVHFMMRTRMINKIYDIGVYRALGATKGRIYEMFTIDLFVVTTFTSIIGYGFTIYLAQYLFKTSIDFIGVSQISALNIILGGLGIYLLNLFFGLLPINRLLAKTPSEIISKYDI